jgi:hypothetical protein
MHVEIHTPDQTSETVCEKYETRRYNTAAIEATDLLREMQNRFGMNRLAGGPSIQIETVEVRCTPGVDLGGCDIENIWLNLYDPHRQMRKGEEQLWVHLGAVGGRWNVPQFFMVQRGNKNRIVRTYGQVFQEVVFGKRSDGCQPDLRYRTQ